MVTKVKGCSYFFVIIKRLIKKKKQFLSACQINNRRLRTNRSAPSLLSFQVFVIVNSFPDNSSNNTSTELPA